jgi:hypothetical protein
LVVLFLYSPVSLHFFLVRFVFLFSSLVHSKKKKKKKNITRYFCFHLLFCDFIEWLALACRGIVAPGWI